MMGLRIAELCPVRCGVAGGACSPGSFLPTSPKGAGPLVCLRSGPRVLHDSRTAIDRSSRVFEAATRDVFRGYALGASPHAPGGGSVTCALVRGL